MKSFSWKHLLTSLGAWRPSQPAALRRGILLLESECLRARHKGAWLTSDDTPHPPEEPRPSLPARVSPIICERLGARDSRSGLHPPSAVHTPLRGPPTPPGLQGGLPCLLPVPKALLVREPGTPEGPASAGSVACSGEKAPSPPWV